MRLSRNSYCYYTQPVRMKSLVAILVVVVLTFHSTSAVNITTNTSCTSDWVDTPCFTTNLSIAETGWKERLLQLTPAGVDGDNCGTNVTVNMVEVLECDVGDDTSLIPDDIFATDCTVFGMSTCDNGRCIDPSLFCNFEDDCGDNSDEYPSKTAILAGCEGGLVTADGTSTATTTIYICGLKEKFGETSIATAYLERWLKGIPGINKFSNGFDILSGVSRGAVLDMSPHGSCRRVLREGLDDEYYRLPANVNSFRQINTLTFPASQMYSNGEELLEALNREIRYDPARAGLISELAGRVGLSQQNEVKEMLLKSTNEATVYVQQNVEITKSEVTLQDPPALIPSEEFVRRVMELPSQDISYDKYLSFVSDFGTHYVSESNLGGVYKQIQQYSRCFLEYGTFEKFTSKTWDEVLPTCARESFFYQLNTDTNPFSGMCQRTEEGERLFLHEQADTTLITTVGGTLAAASNIKFNLGQETWDAWVASIEENPTMNTEKLKLRSITEVMESRYIPMDDERRASVTANLQKAIEIYLGTYDSENLCAKCEKTGDYVDEIVNGSSYLTGTGSDYACYCTYDDVPSLYTCGATSTIVSSFTLLIGLVIAIINL